MDNGSATLGQKVCVKRVLAGLGPKYSDSTPGQVSNVASPDLESSGKGGNPVVPGNHLRALHNRLANERHRSSAPNRLKGKTQNHAEKALRNPKIPAYIGQVWRPDPNVLCAGMSFGPTGAISGTGRTRKR